MQKTDDNTLKLTIAVPQIGYVQNFDTNYYSDWLRDKTGYELEFVTISDDYEEEYLSTMLREKEGRVDVVLLPREKGYIDKELIVSFTEAGLIEDLSEYAVQGTQMKRLLDEAEGIEELNREYNGRLYFMPSIDDGRKQSNMQVLWINMGWLKNLSLQVPETTEDLEKVLTAFKTMDPNGNGINDEIPLISNNTDDSYKSFNYLLNAFSYVDPSKGYIVESNEDDFETGLQYCKDLYDKGLISNLCNEYSINQVRELVNAPDDLVGAFTSESIADIVYPNCEDVLIRFIQVPPLKGPGGEQNAVEQEKDIYIGGFIPANSKHKNEAFTLMDKMLSVEGSLISCFGEENTDWRNAIDGEMSGYGTKASITTLNYLSGKIQNKNYAGIGPMYLAKEYSDAVAWNGDNSFVEYLDARATRIYEQYFMNKAATETEDNKNIVIRLSEQEIEDIQSAIFGSNK